MFISYGNNTCTGITEERPASQNIEEFPHRETEGDEQLPSRGREGDALRAVQIKRRVMYVCV